MLKGLEVKPFGERLRSLGLFGLDMTGDLTAATASHEGKGMGRH